MACPAKGSRTLISVIEETTYGVTPTIEDGDMTVIPRTSASVNLTKEPFEDPTVYSDGQKRFHRHGNKNVGGDVSIAYTHETYDVLLENLFQNNFAGNSLTLGQVGKSLTMQVDHQDKDIQFVHKGLRGNTFSMEVTTSGVVSATFGFIGSDTETPNGSIDNAPMSYNDREPFTHLGGVFKEGNVTSGVITGISLSINNNVTADFSAGSDITTCAKVSNVMVEGTLTAWFTDLALYQKFLNEQESSIDFTLDDGNGNTHRWNLPKVKFNGGDVPVSDAGSLTITLPFVALYDDSINSTVQVVRS